MSDAGSSEVFSFLEKEFIARTTTLVLVKADGEDGKRYFAYVAVPAKKLEQLMEAQRSGKSYKLQDYGHILEAGSGEPDEATVTHMREHYGFKQDAMIMLADGSGS